jgi:hypothetical protein
MKNTMAILAFMASVSMVSTSHAYDSESMRNKTITCVNQTPEPYERTHDVVYQFLGQIDGFNQVLVSMDFGYGPESTEAKTYSVSSKGSLTVQIEGFTNQVDNMSLIFDEKALDLNELKKNQGVITRVIKSLKPITEDSPIGNQYSYKIQTCTLK